MGECYYNIRNAFVGTATPYYVESDENGYFYLESNNIKDGKINRNSEVFINEDFYQSQYDKWLHTGDLVMVQSGHVGHAAVIPEELDGIAAHALIMFQNATGSTDSYFINYQLQMPKSKKKLDFVTTGNTIKHILASEMKQFIVDFPCETAEQTAIGNFFRTLDDTITLYKRKLDGLKELKKGYLQKMFPKVGESVPEIRFSGFSEPWEVRKLGEVVNVNPRSFLPDSFEYVDLESVVGTSLVSHRTENKDTAPSRAQRVAKSGDVFFQMVRPYQRNNYLFDLPFDNYVFSTGYAQLRPKIDSYFLLCKLQEETFVAEVLDHCTGTSYPAINSTDLAEIYVNIAIEESEQTAIGDFFRSLDNQITVQKRKLDQLKQLKTAYLQKMFL